jgi:hypothetical protein
MGEIKDSIPRLQQLVAHMREQLVGLREPQTFEQARLRYKRTVERLAIEGVGRRMMSRVADRDAYWSPTMEVLEEAMRLGFVRREQLPSARRYLESYRDRIYELTDKGREAVGLAEHDQIRFFTDLSEAVVEAHPYFRKFLHLLKDHPLISPELAEGELEMGRSNGRDTDFWAAWAAECINASSGGPVVTAASVKDKMVAVVQKRFGKQPTEKPSNKALAAALNDAFAETSIASRGLAIDATTIKILKAWGSQLRLLDQSRYVPEFQNGNLVWLAADLHEEGGCLRVIRRGLQDYAEAVARAIVAAYRKQAETSKSNLTAPYLPIYTVRAEAAFRCRVTRALVDLVLEQLAAGRFPDLSVQVWLHLGGADAEHPISEPVYRRGGNRRYQITIVN